LKGIWIAAAVAIVIAPDAGWSQPVRSRSAVSTLASLRAGQWIELEGTAQGASPLLCTEVKQLAGDFLDDDCAITGVITSVDAKKREFAIRGCRIRASDRTIYGNDEGAFRGFSDLRPGMLVDVEGTFVQGLTLLAAEIDDESSEMARNPRLKDQVDLVGKLEQVDVRKGVVTVMGIKFQITDKTKLRSVLR
jgi:uncharacterized protein DUF5666